MRYVPLCDGVLVDSGSPLAPTCSGTWLLSIDASGIPGAFDIAVLDPVVLGGFFGAGFLAVGTVLVMAIPAIAVLRSIRSLLNL